MLEVMQWDPLAREAIVMSGFGSNANWYLNVFADGAVEVQIASLRFQPEVRRLEHEEAAQVMADYERRNRIIAPLVRIVLSRLAGFHYDGSPEAQLKLVDMLPLIAFSAYS